VPPPPPPAALSDVRLNSYWRSSSSWRVRIALAFFGVPYEYHAINLLEGGQAAVSEMGQVPRLDWRDGAGKQQSLTQSLAIIEFLCDACAGGLVSSLLPSDPLARARCRQIAEVINSGTHPLQNLSHIKEMQGDRPKEVIDARAIGASAIVKGLAAVEALLVREHASASPRFCVGAHLSLADLCLVPQMYNARRFGVDLSQYPLSLAIEAHLQTLPCYKAAHPDAQPDAVPQ